MRTIAKFKCESKTETEGSRRVYKFHAVCNDGTPENERFHKYTPTASLEMHVDNPVVDFIPGKCYFAVLTDTQD
jgi:hypothetical protein